MSTASLHASPAGIAARVPRMFDTVQVLRGFAAGIVVFHHFCLVMFDYHGQRSHLATFRGLAETGAAGVDVFFCISGLVIAHAARKIAPGSANAADFAWRRILRVVPLYWLFTAILMLGWASGKAFTGLIVTPELVATSLLLIPYPKRTVAGDMSMHPILDVGWTLTFEMYFYAICALIILFAGGRRIFPLVFVALAALAAVSVVMTGSGSVLSSILASPLLVEFALGVALAHFAEPLLAANERLRGMLAPLLIAAGVAGLVASVWDPDAMANRLFWWGIPGALLTAGAMCSRASLNSWIGRGLLFIGTASYTVYLAHPLVTLVIGTLLKRGWFQTFSPDLLIVGFTVLTILATAATYPFLEGPSLRLRRFAKARPARPAQPATEAP